ncbi:DEAD/DEAH box helicase [Stappia sp.]|uniref:DEAD/DEAH box helicase n=1 Tax=Stappia sp. TaxID=1870903 RepID=UPI003C7BB758
MTTFKDLGLADSILKAVEGEGYTTPTPIQAQGIPAILSGGDVLGLAQTGTGKTASFVLPLLHRIAEQGSRPNPKTCGALILAPTRELASQIAESIRAYGQKVRHSSTVVVGGARAMPQIRSLARGMDIVVATPGRLLDHMSTGALRLDETTTVVLDEADHMLDLGFLPAIRKILAAMPRKRQTILLSATMPKPIRALASDFLHEPQEIAVSPTSKPIDRIEQTVLLIERDQKRQALVDVLKRADMDRAIVFTRTKHGADKVTRQLEQAGLNASAIHGNKSQGQRQKTLESFRSGRTPILVATDIAARGIDVDGVSHVVNFELPNVPESYVHRIGRTARAGKSGSAISFCDRSERPFLRDIEKLIGKTLVERDDDGPIGNTSNGKGRKPARRSFKPRTDGAHAGGHSGAHASDGAPSGSRGPRDGKPAGEKRPYRTPRPGTQSEGAQRGRFRGSRSANAS